ncbi:hypothetical protein CO731_04458 [Aminobacter sp. MSH1]|uniref:hypothetical protein n=1 Tax=Aminobacter sp. MSH1 TaxID=374606 RepID=UPI000D376339|nr:hypothetical protein [Aminobacter sp. MSH1]AWC24965.1 hypothetical protein CO731_04458 [Aminobacter sp. MSH1]
MTDAERIEELEAKSGQAYQVIGWLLSECGLFETAEGQRALDYFSEDAFDDDFLPWPATKDLGAKS